MTAASTGQPRRGTAPPTATAVNRHWLLLVHQLPSTPSNLRVQTWRRLQQLGAVPVKQAVYALPDTPDCREDFEWLTTEIRGAGGDATVFAADNVDAWSDEALVEEFRRTRDAAYTTLGREMERALGRLRSPKKREGRKPTPRRLVDTFRQRLATIEQIDFFGAAGRDRVTGLLRQIEEKVSGQPQQAPAPASERKNVRDYAGRVWVTRPRPGVDRMASAWLITRFIDPRARFVFAETPDSAPRAAVPFDMFGVEFSHHGDRCTFETLCAMFTIADPAVERVGTIVHDLDLKDERFGTPEADTVGALIEGLQLSVSDDQALLAHGMTLFESFYRSFAGSRRTARPRPHAGARRQTRVRRSS